MHLYGDLCFKPPSCHVFLMFSRLFIGSSATLLTQMELQTVGNQEIAVLLLGFCVHVSLRSSQTLYLLLVPV